MPDPTPASRAVAADRVRLAKMAVLCAGISRMDALDYHFGEMERR